MPNVVGLIDDSRRYLLAVDRFYYPPYLPLRRLPLLLLLLLLPRNRRRGQ